MLKKIINKIKASVGTKAAIVYTIANIFSRGLAIITMPIFTRLMSTNQIGIVNLYNSWFSIISSIATLSLTSGGFPVAMKEFENNRKKYISSILCLTSLIAIVFSIIYFCNMDFWNNLTGLPTSMMILILIGLLFAPATDFWLAYERYEYRYKTSALVVMTSALIASVSSSVIVILMSQKGYENLAEYRLIANYIVIYIVAIILWITIFIKGKCYFNLKYWKFSLSISIPLVGYSIASQILGVSDRMMISKMIDNSAVGIYSTVYSISSLFTMVWTAINASFVPYLYQNIEKNNKEIKKVLSSILLGYSIVSILFVLLSPEIIKIFATSEYYEAIYIMPPIAIGVFMTSVSNVYSNILLYLKKSKYIMFSATLAAIINIILNYWLIPIYGYMVAAYTTMFSYLVMLIMLIICSNKLYRKLKNDSLNSIYDNHKIIIITIFNTIFLLFEIVLYRYNFFRYIVIILYIFVILKYISTKLKIKN